MNKKIVLVVIILLLSIFLSGCVIQWNTPSKPIAYEDLSTNCKTLVDKYNFSLIRQCSEESIALGQKQVLLVSFVFGPGMDCPSGCIYNRYAAVIDNGNEYSISQSFVSSYLEPNLAPPYPQIFELAENINDSVTLYYVERFIGDYLFINESSCYNIASEKYKSKCLEEFNWIKDKKYFDSINYNANRNISLCDKALTLKWKEECIVFVAFNLKDPDLCDKLTNPDKRNFACLGQMYAYYNKEKMPPSIEAAVDVCKRMDPTYSKTDDGNPEIFYCLKYAAMHFNDSSICDYIDQNHLKNMCIEDVSYYTKLRK